MTAHYRHFQNNPTPTKDYRSSWIGKRTNIGRIDQESMNVLQARAAKRLPLFKDNLLYTKWLGLESSSNSHSPLAEGPMDEGVDDDGDAAAEASERCRIRRMKTKMMAVRYSVHGI